MWRIFTGRAKNEQEKGPAEEESQLHFGHLRHHIQLQIVSLTQQYRQAQSIFRDHYGVSPQETALTSTFQQLMATIQGLLAIIGQLEGQYEEMQSEAEEGRRARAMLQNHTSTITDIQDTHSRQVHRIYEQHHQKEQEMNRLLQSLQLKNQQLEDDLQHLMAKMTHLYQRNSALETQIAAAVSQKQQAILRADQLEQRYRALVGRVETAPPKKMIDIQHPQLQFLFYFSKLKQKMVGYLSLGDLLSFQRASKFYYHILKKQQAHKINQHFKLHYEKRISNEIQRARLYQKVYELFPLQNIKINAFKYLHFRIKPATYILPFLQEEHPDPAKKDQQQDPQQKQTNKFSWKFWGSEKKVEKKGDEKEGKFSLATLKNEEEFRRIEQRIQATFKSILQVDMPEDLQYFSENMEKQLQQLKVDLVQSKQGKTGHLEWASQLYCLTRYMYHEINQLYNLLQVIFGELVKKNRDLAGVTQDYQYLKENQQVLRNLIQNLSGDKSEIEKKYLMVQNQILKKNLQKETLQNKMDKLVQQHSTLSSNYQLLEQEHAHCRGSIQKLTENRSKIEGRFKAIRDQLQLLEKMPTRIRKSSMGSVSSEQPGLQEVSNS